MQNCAEKLTMIGKIEMPRCATCRKPLFATIALALVLPHARAVDRGLEPDGYRDHDGGQVYQDKGGSLAPMGYGAPTPVSTAPEIVTRLPAPELIAHKQATVPKSATIEDVRTEVDVYEEGRRGMRIRAKVSVDGLKGKKACFIAFFRGEDGQKLKDPDGKSFRTKDGDICCWRDVIPPYDSSLWEETTLFMPYEQLHLGRGSHGLVYKLEVWDESGKKPVELASGKFKGFAFTGHGRSASVENLRVDHNVFKGGRKGMQIHARINVEGMKGEKASFLCYFYDGSGNHLKDSDKKYNTTAGNVCCWMDVVPSYDDALWEDMTLFMPYDQLHLTGDRDSINLRITVQDESGKSPKSMVKSDSVAFSYTHPDAWATVDDVRSEFDVTQNGKRGLRIHSRVGINGLKGKQAEVAAYFHFSSGAKLKDFDGQYDTSDGHVAIHDRVTPSYDSSEWKDFILFMPYDQLHLAKGKHSCKYDIRVWNISGPSAVKLVESDWQAFTYTKN